MKYINGKFWELPVVKIASIENAENAYILVDEELIDKCSMRQLVKEYTMENGNEIDLKELNRLGNCRIRVLRKPNREIVKARFDIDGGNWTFTHNRRTLKVGTEVFYKCYTPFDPKPCIKLLDVRRKFMSDGYTITFRYLTPLGAFETGIIEEKRVKDKLEYYFHGTKFMERSVGEKPMTVGDIAKFFISKKAGTPEKTMYFRAKNKSTQKVEEFYA